MKEAEVQIPKSVKEKAEAAKKYIEKKYSMNQMKAEQKAENWKNFQQKLKSMQLSSEQEQIIKKEVIHEEMEECRRRRQKISRKNFESLAVIGRGAFGEVRLCREVKTKRIVAIKCLKKKEMIKKNQQNHLRDERNVLADGSEWIVKLLYSFQDQVYLYLVMEFLAGGDLMTLLIERNVVSESEARFYAAQTILALESVHRLNYIHRDLKPDNILIDSTGHIKLSDFGLCKETTISDEDDEDLHRCKRINFKEIKNSQNSYNKMIGFKKKNRKLAYSAVGTPDYIAPEMLSRNGYTETVDWWSIGIMIYEMLIGYAPFSADSNEEIYYKIQNHHNFLFFPPEVDLSEEVIDLISRLVTDEGHRLGRNGVSDIQKHPWFRGINWQNIRSTKPPFIPEVKNEIDTKYFDDYEEKEPWIYNPNDPNYRKDFNFIGYTYKDEQQKEKDEDIFEKALGKAEKEKKKEMLKEQEWLDMLKTNMKKKKKAPLETTKIYLSKKPNMKTQNVSSFINCKSELYTDRSRSNIKSKSPLAERDSNMSRKNAGGASSKSPLVNQKSTSYLRKPQTNAYSTSVFQQTLTRKSLNNRK